MLKIFALCTGFSCAASGAMAADNCFAQGQRYASEQAATFVAGEAATKDGQSVCKIVVLKQAEANERPKREVVYLPR